MMLRHRLTDPRNRLDIVAGLVDGILNALTLAAGRMVHGAGADLMLALRVGTATGLTTIFVFFMAHYAELRAEIARSERQLNLASHGKLATSRLGQRAVRESLAGAALAAVCGVSGSVLSLLLCAWLPEPHWLGLAADIALLGLLGVLLARSVHGSPLIWAPSIMAGGVVLTLIGVEIDIAS
ncbi:MAG: hypothetical protein QM688_10445 [Sphingomonas bacterium]